VARTERLQIILNLKGNVRISLRHGVGKRSERLDNTFVFHFFLLLIGGVSLYFLLGSVSQNKDPSYEVVRRMMGPQ
jgi:hypothetical protein